MLNAERSAIEPHCGIDRAGRRSAEQQSEKAAMIGQFEEGLT